MPVAAMAPTQHVLQPTDFDFRGDVVLRIRLAAAADVAWPPPADDELDLTDLGPGEDRELRHRVAAAMLTMRPGERLVVLWPEHRTTDPLTHAYRNGLRWRGAWDGPEDADLAAAPAHPVCDRD
jgi:hypothetical protein